jgi:hypothetical protein
MKKTLTIILLSISLSGFSQTEKRDFVITPTVGRSTYATSTDADRSISQIRFPIEFHKYLSNRFAVGFRIYGFYQSMKPNITNQFEQNDTQINISPEIRYNFLKTKLTPFVTGRILDFGYNNTFYDNPNTPVALRRISNFYFSSGFGVNLGISYFVKERFGLQLSLATVYNETDGIKAQFNIPYNIGLQFIINNPRQ